MTIALTFSVILALSLMIGSVSTLGLDTICPATATTALKQTSLNNAFNYFSYYLNGDVESTPIIVSKASGTPFKLNSYLNDGTLSTERSCTGTTAYTYENLIQNMMIVKDTAGDYYVCKYDNTTDSSPIKVDRTTVVGSVTFTSVNFVQVDGNDLLAIATDATTNYQVKYTWSASGVSGVKTYSASPVFTKFAGSFDLYFDPTTKDMKSWSSNTRVGPSDYTTAQNILFYPLAKKNLVVARTKNSQQDSDADLFLESTYTPISDFSVTNSASQLITYFSDNLYNFGMIATGKFVWLTITQVGTSFFMTTITNPTGDNVDNIFNIAFSQNKATIVTKTGKLTVYKHKNTNQYDALFSQKGTDGTLTLDNTAQQYKIQLSCLCQGIQAFACFSQTLNCVILNQASGQCGGKDTYVSW